MSRYEAAIVGAGPEALVASIVLARAGLRVLVLEKSDAPGGRATTLEFHPGFRASPYADELPAMPHRLYRSLGLAQNLPRAGPVRGSNYIVGPAAEGLLQESSRE